MTHDLLKNLVLSFDTELKHIYINELSEGTFYAQIVCDKDNQVLELDARPSDAIALAVRFNAPIYVNSEVLDEAGISTDPEPQDVQGTPRSQEPEPGQKELSQLEKLEVELNTAVETENYEKAAKIRDQISKMKG